MVRTIGSRSQSRAFPDIPRIVTSRPWTPQVSWSSRRSEQVGAGEEVRAEEHCAGEEGAHDVGKETAFPRSRRGVVLAVGMVGLSEHVVLRGPVRRVWHPAQTIVADQLPTGILTDAEGGSPDRTSSCPAPPSLSE